MPAPYISDRGFLGRYNLQNTDLSKHGFIGKREEEVEEEVCGEEEELCSQRYVVFYRPLRLWIAGFFEHAVHGRLGGFGAGAVGGVLVELGLGGHAVVQGRFLIVAGAIAHPRPSNNDRR